jgi:hypothetical protein
MQTSFLGDVSKISDFRIALNIALTPQPSRETVKLLAIGSRRGVMRVIHTLHIKNFAEVGAWSPLLPAPTPSEVMSILTLNISVE